jgi:antitoxin (DNA-binding transcriptional repressor) of toxin-antitoxin stability system
MNSQTISIKNLRASLSNIADEVEFRGKSFQVFRRSKPSFKIVPIDAEVNEWETVVDFTTENGEGIDINQALEILE